MITIESIKELREHIAKVKQQGKTIGFVPTMGYLHSGHMSLVQEAKKQCAFVVMSIFVNPLQFGPNEDFAKYPRDLARDAQMASEHGVDLLFAPTVEEMYPKPMKTSVHVADITDQLCGGSRPGHFAGVATVVSKLFHIVQPDSAFFGLKDAQQVAVLSKMVEDLNMPVQIVPCPIVREPDGLALSSRNVFLSEEERKQAVVLSQSLNEAKSAFEAGKSPSAIRDQIIAQISSKPLAKIDYVEILTYPELVPLDYFKGTPFIIALAVKFGTTRLIDNQLFSGVRGDEHVSHDVESKIAPSYSY
jgi:pantoate--beta-alanine ligase